MSSPLSASEAKELIRLCESGRLYEVEAWVAGGRSLIVPKEVRKTPLRVAISTGFHSLVELMLRHEPRQSEKDDALRHALFLNSPTFVELALAHGASIAAIPFLDVLMTDDRALVAAFLEKGADATTDYPFAHSFHQLRAKTTLGSYLDCRRSRPDLAEQLQQQADMALRQFCQEGNVKWVSLLIWAGANPRSRGPALDDVDHIEDSEWHTTAIAEACFSGNVDILKKLKPSPTDDLAGMLERAAFSAHRDVLAYLLDLGANPNDRPDGGSSALEACIRHLGWEDFDRIRYGYGANYQTPGHKVSKGREAIRLLVERGAIWKPDPSTVNATRRTLYRLEPDVTLELLARLLSQPDGENAVRELLRVPRMRKHVASCERELSRLGLTVDGRRRAHVVPTRPPSRYLLAQYDRERLYEEVWSEPTQKVALKYGISDVALSKVCKQLQVPKPPRGYWAKKDAGRPVQRRPRLAPLPRAQEALG
jgi:ankyrin repeat protein